MNPLLSLARGLKLLAEPSAWRYMLGTRCRSVASYRICKAVGRIEPGFGTVIDVGANQGQFALAAAWCFPKARVFSFEPVPATVEVLRENIRRNPRVTVCPVALGAANGELGFFESAYSHASSALPVHENQRQIWPETAKVHEIKVPVCRLDSWDFQGSLAGPVLLKLDVQGYEREVLKGAENLLSKVDYLVFEASFVRLYEGEPLFEEMHEFVKGLGFGIVGPVGMLEGNDGQILQMDMLYQRSRH
jgi:FkbM family methyltransferase